MSVTRSAKETWWPSAEFYSAGKCTRCGICCGSTDGHPCEHLQKSSDGQYFCEIYDQRLGPHKTVDGQSFVCVPIKRLIEFNGGYEDCAYVREILHIRKKMGQDASDVGRHKKP